MNVDHARSLVEEVRRTGRRALHGAPRADHDGTHFVTLIKPEALSSSAAVDAMTEVVRVLVGGDVTIVRCALIPASDYLARGFLLLHYPRLHRVAAMAASGLCSDPRRRLSSLTASSGAVGVVGAFQAMAYDPDLSPAMLEARCEEAGVHKLGSGSYASAVLLKKRVVAVLNGFLPALALSYANSDALVAILECHSHREIADLRARLLGDLDPRAAPPTSLRGALSALISEQYGGALSKGRNGVHLSAGHLEGMFQVRTYFAVGDDHGLEGTALGRSLSSRGVSMSAVGALAFDPDLTNERGETFGPHGATENLRREEVLDLVQQWTRAGNSAL